MIGDLISQKRDWIWYILGVVLTPLLVAQIGLSREQTFAVGGFCVVIYGAILFWRYRLAFAFIGVALLMTANLLDVPHFVEFAGLDIIIFLVAMMTIVGFLEERKFFEWMIDRLLLVVGPHPKRLMTVMMIMAAVSAALVDEVTSILFMVSSMLNVIKGSKLNPVPFIMMLVFTTNIGSSATVVGNPVGVIIALRSGLSFFDFIRWATPISVVGVAMAIPICLWIFKKDIHALKGVLAGKRGEEKLKGMLESAHINQKEIRIAGILFGLVILGLVLHHPIENVLGLAKNTMLLGIALLGAGVALGLSGDKARDLMEKRVDWWTLSFFLMLFASVGTLKQTGVTTVIAQQILEVSGGSIPFLVTLFVWSSGALTAVMDNVLAVATYVPIIEEVKAAGIQTFPLWWATLVGCTFLGNLTLIGSTANIVAVGLMERRKLGEITFAQWLRPGFLVAVPTLVVANLLILAQLRLMPYSVSGPIGH